MKLQSHAATAFIQSGSSQITRSPIHIISCWICMKLHPLRRNWQAQKQTDQNIHTFTLTLTHRHESERPLDVLIKPEGTAGTDDSLSRDKSAHRHAQTHKHTLTGQQESCLNISPWKAGVLSSKSESFVIQYVENWQKDRRAHVSGSLERDRMHILSSHFIINKSER